MVYKIKRYSRTAYLPGGPLDLEDLTDRQLENMSRYKGPSRWWKTHVEYPGHVAAGAAGAGIGYLATGSPKGAAVGGTIGAGLSVVGHEAAHRHHKKNAEEAMKILRERKEK